MSPELRRKQAPVLLQQTHHLPTSCCRADTRPSWRIATRVRNQHLPAQRPQRPLNCSVLHFPLETTRTKSQHSVFHEAPSLLAHLPAFPQHSTLPCTQMCALYKAWSSLLSLSCPTPSSSPCFLGWSPKSHLSPNLTVKATSFRSSFLSPTTPNQPSCTAFPNRSLLLVLPVSLTEMMQLLWEGGTTPMQRPSRSTKVAGKLGLNEEENFLCDLWRTSSYGERVLRKQEQDEVGSITYGDVRTKSTTQVICMH